MAAHKKNPVFLRIITTDKAVVCINPLQLSTFQILSGAQVKKLKAGIKPDVKPTADDYEVVSADTIRFFFPSGTGLSYSVGIDITQIDFNYICATLLEYLYLNEGEFKEKTAMIEQARMDEWNKISLENQGKLTPEVK